MKIHIYIIFSNNAQDSPLVKALIAAGNDTKAVSSKVRLNYRNKILSYLIGIPKLLWFSFKAANYTLRHSKSVDCVIVHNHFDIMMLTIMSKFIGRKPKIVCPGFIYTQHLAKSIQKIKYQYYRWILKNSDVVICHSRYEIEENKQIFSGLGVTFLFMPYSTHINCATGFKPESLKSNIIVSAGRSGRDYTTLINAIKNTDIVLQIISDRAIKTDGDIAPSKQVEVHKGCYGWDYFSKIQQARIVVIPLKDNQISAGQMVMLDAMSMGKPVVITKTYTTVEYYEKNSGILLVEQGDVDNLSSVISRLMQDDDFCSSMGRAAADTYNKKYTITAYANGLTEAVCIAVKG